MKQYQDYLKYILENGTKKEDRTGTGTLSVFGYQMRFDLSKGFPLVTTKKLHFKSIAYELLWFLRGDTNTKFLTDNGVTIWDEWALKEDYKESDKYGNYVTKARKDDIGRMYGYQWINWETNHGTSINQISEVIKQIKSNPNSRRLIVSSWNVGDLPNESFSPKENIQMGNMALAPCHYSFQVYTKELDVFERICTLQPDEKEYSQELIDDISDLDVFNKTWTDDLKLKWINKAEFILNKHNIPKRSISMIVNLRSSDSFLGCPYNIASYALLTHMIAHQCNMQVGELIWNGGDCHIYTNHIEQVKLQLTRHPYPLPKLNFKRKPESIFDYKFEDFEIVDYKAHAHIKGEVAI